MFHPNTERMIQFWRSRRQGGFLPPRSAVSPIDLGWILPQVFLLGLEEQALDFRLCGGLMVDLYGRDLRGTSFYALWSKHERPMVSEAHARTIRAGAPVVLTVDAHSPQSGAVGLEICLAPLTGPEGAPNRTLGLLQPISMLSRLMGQPIATLSLRAIELAPEVGRPSKLRLVALNGLRVA